MRWFCLLAGAASVAWAQPALSPCPPERVLEHLDLDRPGLGPVREAAGNHALAMARLLDYYRTRKKVRYDTRISPADAAEIASARATLAHVLDAGLGYPPQRYGADINWMADPVRDIEWVAGVQRFYWQTPLLRAWVSTHDTAYARGWMDLTADWIGKHPVDPKHFAWLDIQVGIRAARFAEAFDLLRTSPAMDAGFLQTLLASVYDHGRKMSLYPRTTPHNKAVIEAVGLLRLGVMFPEFKDSGRWTSKAWEVLSDNLPRQVTPEGVQREWTPNYHQLVASLMLHTLLLADANGLPAPPPLRDLTAKMFDVWFAMTAPDGWQPMFGDGRRPPEGKPDPSDLLLAARLFDRPEFFAVTDSGKASAPHWLSRAFPESGMYFFRSGWDRDATYLALHSSPPAISAHDQPDNGTFELYAGRRWLIEDSGSFAYPDTPFANERDWFSRTAAHATLTLDGANSRNAHRHLLWRTGAAGDTLVFENESYPRLTHRRTVFFTGRRWFVFVDEALGDAPGRLELRFPFPPGTIQVDRREKWARTGFAQGANLLVWAPPESQASLEIEDGQISYTLNHKQTRQVALYRHQHPAPAVFVTLLAPYDGAQPPRPSVRIKGTFQPGQPRVELDVAIGKEHWLAGRDLSLKTAWITKE
ncbi:MAG: alginate lyase family protein [Bryobacterales bacterium]|nr:alginate lyase family protein [Bryobacterales bacterium]